MTSLGANSYGKNLVVNNNLEVKGEFKYAPPEQIEELYKTNFSDGTPGIGINREGNDVPWTIDTTKGNGNLFSLRCILGANANYSSSIDYTFNAPGAVSRITFDYQQSLEGHPWDALSVYVDGVELFHGENNGTGPDEWTAAEIIVFGEGAHTIEFKGYTDGSVFNSPDTIWVDNLKIVHIVANFVPTANSVFKGFLTLEKTGYLEKDLRVVGKTHLNDLSVVSPVSVFAGAIESDFVGDKNYSFLSKGDKVLAPNEIFSTVKGGYRMSTPTNPHQNTQNLMGVMNTGDSANPSLWDNAGPNEDMPYSFLMLKRANKTNVFISSMPKDKGASQIGSRLQLGHDQYSPNLTNTNTLDVNGNIMASEDIEGRGLIIKSPNGTRYRITVSDGGALSATAA